MKATPPGGGASWLFFGCYIEKHFTKLSQKRAAPPGQEKSRSPWDHSTKSTAPIPFLPEPGSLVKTPARGKGDANAD